MKKLLALVLALLMLTLTLASCAAKNTVASDLEYIKEKGKLVVGITDFKPMDYQDEEGNWIGFDADLSKAFAEKLGVEVEFVVINWDNKVLELENKTIDCVWNGMTLTDTVKAAMECSVPYCNNQQVVVMSKEQIDQYETIKDCYELNFAVEGGSAGEAVAIENELKTVSVLDQATAIMEVSSKKSDAAIIDSLMAAALLDDEAYADLGYTLPLTSEEYGVGFRKGSDVAAELNKFLEEVKADGTMLALAQAYGVQAALIK